MFPVSSTVIVSPVTFLFSLTTWDSCILNRIRYHEPQLLYQELDSLERRCDEAVMPVYFSLFSAQILHFPEVGIFRHQRLTDYSPVIVLRFYLEE